MFDTNVDDTTGRTNDDQPKLTLAIVEDLKAKRHTQGDIARMFGVTRQYASWIKYTYGGRLTPRERVLREFPWKVPEPMTQHSPYRRMREHGEYVATNGVGMSPEKLYRFHRRERALTNTVPGGTPRDGRGVGDQSRPPTARDGQLPSGGRCPIPIALLHRPNREDRDSVFVARVGIRPISETFLASSKSTHSAASQSGMRSGIRSTVTTTSIRYGPRAFGMPEKPRDGGWVCGQTRMICRARVRASKVCPGREDDLGRLCSERKVSSEYSGTGQE